MNPGTVPSREFLRMTRGYPLDDIDLKPRCN